MTFLQALQELATKPLNLISRPTFKIQTFCTTQP